jgi:hypothetical protein
MVDELMARIAGRFGRVEPRRRVRAFVLGLIAGLPRNRRARGRCDQGRNAAPAGACLLGRRRGAIS